MEKNAKIFVAGHRGLVGSSIVRALEKQGYTNIITRTRAELDLTRQTDVEAFFKKEQPEYVFVSGAKVGGIVANNTYPADFSYENLMIEANMINAAHLYGAKKLLFLGSSCIYPREAPQPIKEEYLLTGPLEQTNEAYAIAKIAGISLCKSYRQQHGKNFISAMPTNLYGPGDNFHPTNSHVLPALIRRFHEAKIANSPTVTAWGTGKVYREFLYIDDLADALVLLMNVYDGSSIVNVGTGIDMTIKELTEIVAQVVEYKGKIVWDSTKPDGTPKKQLDISKIQALGWKPKTSLQEGIKKTYEWFLAQELST
jgi:GDP-L-fucose synthase